MNIKYDSEEEQITINDYTFSIPDEISVFIKRNDWDTKWEKFAFADFKPADYKHLMGLYRDCGAKWLNSLHFMNVDDRWTRRGRIVIGQIAKDVYIFYTTCHKTYNKLSLRTLNSTKKQSHTQDFFYPETCGSWTNHTLNSKHPIPPSLLHSWRGFLKKQWSENYDNLLPDAISKISAFLIEDL